MLWNTCPLFITWLVHRLRFNLCQSTNCSHCYITILQEATLFCFPLHFSNCNVSIKQYYIFHTVSQYKSIKITFISILYMSTLRCTSYNYIYILCLYCLVRDIGVVGTILISQWKLKFQNWSAVKLFCHMENLSCLQIIAAAYCIKSYNIFLPMCYFDTCFCPFHDAVLQSWDACKRWLQAHQWVAQFCRNETEWVSTGLQ
jgi:hypothetical protein